MRRDAMHPNHPNPIDAGASAHGLEQRMSCALTFAPTCCALSLATWEPPDGCQHQPATQSARPAVSVLAARCLRPQSMSFATSTSTSPYPSLSYIHLYVHLQAACSLCQQDNRAATRHATVLRPASPLSCQSISQGTHPLHAVNTSTSQCPSLCTNSHSPVLLSVDNSETSRSTPSVLAGALHISTV
ncbi:hypothetical protein BKA80DRAFT_281755 [Phyllosticta citrichinensis]